MPHFTAEHTITSKAPSKEVLSVLTNGEQFTEFVPGCLSAKLVLPETSQLIDAPDAGATWSFIFQALLRFSITVRLEAVGSHTILVTQTAGELLTELLIRFDIRAKEMETELFCRFEVTLLGQIPEASWQRFARQALPAALLAVGQRAEQQAAVGAV